VGFSLAPGAFLLNGTDTERRERGCTEFLTITTLIYPLGDYRGIGVNPV
jgi:hypothetical protein